MCAFVAAQLVATLITVYANIGFASINGIGWGWAGVIWLYSLIFYFPLDIIKFIVRYALSGEAWNLLFDKKTAFTSKKDYGKEDREARWVLSQRSLQGLHSTDSEGERGPKRRYCIIAEQAKRRAEIARLREIHTLKGHVESVMRLKNLDLLAYSFLSKLESSKMDSAACFLVPGRLFKAICLFEELTSLGCDLLSCPIFGHAVNGSNMHDLD